MKKIKISFSLIIALLVSFSIHAQSQLSLSGNFAFPLGNFAEQLDQVPVGTSLKLLKNSSKVPLAYGVELANYGYNSYEFQTELSDFGMPGVTVEQRNKDLFHSVELFMRYKFNDDKKFQQYVEGRFGSTAFITISKIWQEELELRNINLNILDASITGGVGAGITYEVDSKWFPFTVDVGTVISTGSKAKFNKYVENEAPQLIEANPTTIALKLGLIANFGGCNCEGDKTKVDNLELTDPLGDK